MAWIRCKYCNKRISDKVETCPKCGKGLILEKSNVRTIVCGAVNITCVLVQFVVCILLLLFSDELLYSGYNRDLYIVLGLCLVLFFNIFIFIRHIVLSKKKSLFSLILVLVGLTSFVIGSIYGVIGINACIYDNSVEVVNLAEKFELDEAKRLKLKIENIFEYDFDNVASRDIIIGNFYEEDDEYILYLDDSYGNYRLKFYVNMDDGTFRDIYWLYDESVKLYLMKDGSKTEDFEYYYAMYILKNLIGEEVSGLATIDADVEKRVNKFFEDSAALMFTYEQLNYDGDNNTFSWQCYVENMDYYGNMDRYDFVIDFSKVDDDDSRNIWYYGDSSFDYVNWDVKI